MRVLTRNESAVFLLSLLTVCLFLSRLFALTKQLCPSKSLTRMKVVIGEPSESTLYILQMANLYKKICIYQKKVVSLPPNWDYF